MRRVQCEHCDQEYFYELARIGRGRSHTIYGIGQASARAKALARARRKVQKLLDRDLELVPCPNCRQLQPDMIEHARRARLSGMWIVGVVTVSLGMLGALLAFILFKIDAREWERAIDHLVYPEPSSQSGSDWLWSRCGGSWSRVSIRRPLHFRPAHRLRSSASARRRTTVSLRLLIRKKALIRMPIPDR